MRHKLTIWEALAVKLGQQPTHNEAVAEVKRILQECMVERATAGKLPFQRRKAS